MSQKKCDCGGIIDWKVVNASLGRAFHKGLCIKCNSVYTEHEVPEHKLGRKLANEIGIIKTDDKRLKRQSVNTQIGYYRAIQHCSTCRNPIGVVCRCKNCNCIYCKQKIKTL